MSSAPLTPLQRRKIWREFQFKDHAFLRAVWANFSFVADGVFRSSQPSPKQLKKYKFQGFRSIVNLRGESSKSFHFLENEACVALDLELYSLNFCPGGLPSKASLIELHDIFTRAEKPMILHCKSGADRSGIAAALYLMMFNGADVPTARKHLHWRYLHVKSRKMGVFDHIIDEYEAANQTSDIGILDWITSTYEADTIKASYAKTLR